MDFYSICTKREARNDIDQEGNEWIIYVGQESRNNVEQEGKGYYRTGRQGII